MSDAGGQRLGIVPTDLDGVTDLVLGVFNEVLGLREVAEDDDFFDACGGTSVQAWWAISDIEDLLGVDMEFKAFLRTPTARATASLLIGMVEARRSATMLRR